ncbi:tetratricopeptide repeat protein 1 [Paecilomyces variotii No. 5]|uniref:Tetratricopeptide repeat protein 1 n=1 Tax=Byssochlamys spectabilis (strain No. 5 / NBRC 109023) TaxID=1356009 RepID=V5G1L7_BYSSN|nr:tetratricopeptide repeat protein 1 [Paecilomyces variotii No. 5]
MAKQEAIPENRKAKKNGRGADSDSENEDEFHDARFPAEEEARLLEESHAVKSEANKLFAAACYDQAISAYDRALASCPNYLDYEIAVLRSNIAACHLKLEDWKSASDAATASIEALERYLPSSKPNPNDAENDKETKPGEQADAGAVVELSGEDEEAEKQLEILKRNDEEKENVRRIRAKALMRRARAKTELDGWANLQGAEEDYRELMGMDNLPPQDKKIVQKALRELPNRINQAREKEIGDMMGKLKDLGNGILKPFGLSTDNFNFVKDEKTGGYSMNFQS